MEKRAIATVSLGAGFAAVSRITHPAMARYAQACGADFIVWNDLPERYRHAHFRRFAIADELRNYERVLYLDSDIFVRPGADNLFERVAPDQVGMCDEASFHDPGWAADRMQRALAFNNRVLAERGRAPFAGAWNGSYFNGGVTLTAPAHHVIYTMPDYDPCSTAWDGGPVTHGRVENQPYLNFMLHYHGVPVQDLGYRFNCTNPYLRVNNRTLAHVETCHFFHATGNLRTKLATLRRLLPLLTRVSDG